jgi:CrcB protein
MILLLVVAGAAVGAPLRYLTDRAISSRWDSVFPLGTLMVNVCGSLVLGFLFGGAQEHAVSAQVTALLGTGFCGALTTYSTFGYETVRFTRERSHGYALANVAANLLFGCAAAFAGAGIAHAIF